MANTNVSIKTLRKKAQKGDHNALNELSFIYIRKNDWDKAFEWTSKAAKKGNRITQYNLAFMYEDGKGVEKDSAEAIEWYTKAAEQGYLKAQVNLANMYRLGEGVDKNFTKAIEWYTKAAEQDLSEAQFNLALMYENVEGEEKNIEKAIEWYTKAAEQDDPNAQFNLALMYHQGERVKKDLEKAIEWYTKAAEQGHLKAQFNLALIYYEGDKKNHAQAFKWFNKADKKSQPYASLYLASMYYHGNGVDQNFEQAYEAVIDFQKIIPENPYINFLIKKCLNKINKKDDTIFNHVETDTPVSSVSTLLAEIKKIRKENQGKTILFRGHADKNWKLIPTVHRNDDHHLETFKNNFQNHYTQCFDQPLDKNMSQFEVKTHMQHYEIPTDLLDWSYSPLSALYFALSLDGDFRETPITDTCIWVAVTNESIHLGIPDKKKNLKQKKKAKQKPATRNPSKLIQFATTPASNRRMQAQKGLFSYTESEQCLTEIVHEPVNKGIKLYRLCLENDFLGDKNDKYKEELTNMGINPISMYPDARGLKEEVIGYSKNIASVETIKSIETSQDNYNAKSETVIVTTEMKPEPTPEPSI